MREQHLGGFPWSPLLAMLLAACLALWLLWQPELIRALPLIIKLPFMALGIWALGAGFAQGQGLQLPLAWLRWCLSSNVSWVVLGCFTLLLFLRAWWL